MSTLGAMMIDLWQGSLVRACIQGSLVILGATVVETAWRRMPGSLRSWMWRLVFVKIVWALVCGWSIPLPLLPGNTARAAAPVRRTAVELEEPVTMEFVPGASSPVPWRWADGGLAVWLVGVAGCGWLLWRGGRTTRQQCANGRLIQHPYAEELLASLCAKFSLKVRPQLKLLRGGGSPCVLGGRRPTILVPQAWLETCNAEQLRLALAHELAHVVRRDLLWNQLVVVGRMMLFFHPLVWWAARRYAAAQELACDELALRRTGGSPAVLARMLLQFVEEPAADEWAGAAAMIGANSTLRERIVAMQRLFISPSPSTATTAALFAAGLLLLAPFSLAEQKSTIESPSDPPKSASVKKPKKNGVSASASASGQAFGIAGGGGSGGIATSGARATAKVSTSDADGEDQPAPGKKSVDSPNDLPPKKTTGRNSNQVQQKMTSTNDGDGEKWTRTTDAREGDRVIKIEETPERIRVVVTEKSTGKETVTVATSAEELQEKNATAYEAFRKYAGDKANKVTAKALAAQGAKALGGAGGGADAFGGALGEGFKGKFGGEFGGADANALLKEKLRELRGNDDVRGTPLEGLLKDLEEQVDNAE